MFFKKNFLTQEYLSHSVSETEQIASKIFNLIKELKITNIFFYGELGVGKTTIIKDILSLFEVEKKSITSPSFGTKNIYEANKKSFYHYDLYLLKKENFTQLNYLDEDLKSENYVLVEWANKVKQLDKLKDIIKIKMTRTKDDNVNIKIEVKK